MDCIIAVAEKPSIADAIAKALASSPITTRSATGVRTHEFQGRYEGRQCEFRVTSVLGHCFSLDFAEAYRDWDACDPAELWDAPVVSVPTSGGVLKNLRETASGGDALILFLDCDREGEAIAFQVIDVCGPQLRRGAAIRRAKFSSVTAEDIARAMRSLGEPDANLAEAVLARQELDLRVGVAFTRFSTKHFLDKYALLDARLLSYGPCQTPTLGFVVQREDEIATFAPEPFWELTAEATLAGEAVDVAWQRKRCFDRAVAAALARGCGAEAVVAEATEGTRAQPPPLPFNTVELLKTASKVLRLSPAQTMRHAEHLYLDGHLSYPRTETNKFPPSFDVEGALRQQAGDDRWGAYARRLLDDGAWSRPRRGRGRQPHPPITPTAPFDGGGPAGRLYELVARRSLAAVSPDALRRAQRVALRERATGEAFTFSREVLLEPGFLEVLQTRRDDEREGCSLVEPLPAAGAAVPLRVDAVPRERQTRPPDRLTEAECVALMEKHGIGTDASIPSHIENVCKRNYVQVDPGRRRPTTVLGLALARGFGVVDAALVQPAVRAQIEKLCDVVGARRRAAGPRRRARDSNVRGKICLLHQQPRRRRGPLRRRLRRAARGRQGRAALRPRRADGAVPAQAGPAPLRAGDEGAPAAARARRRREPQRGALPRLPVGAAALRAPRRARGPRPHGRGVPALRALLRRRGRRRRTFPMPASTGFVASAFHAAASRRAPRSTPPRRRRSGAPPSLCLECPMPDGHPALGAFLVARMRDIFGGAARGVAVLEPGRAGAKTRPRIVSTRPPIFVGTFHASVASVSIAGVASASHLPRASPRWTKARALARGRRPTPS